MAMRRRARCGPERSAGGTPQQAGTPAPALRPERGSVVVAAVLAAAARALDLERDPAAVGALHGRLDPGHALAQAGEARDALEAGAGGDLDADRAPLGVVQAEGAVVAV